MKQMLFRAKPIFAFQYSRFSSVTIAQLENAIQTGQTSSLLKDIKVKEIIDSQDIKWVAKVLKSHTIAEENDKNYDHVVKAAAINEFFRKQFRKLTLEQTLEFIKEFSSIRDISPSLDTKFWIWESIEESIRGEVDNLSVADFDLAYQAFLYNFKGSRELHDSFEQRMMRDYA